MPLVIFTPRVSVRRMCTPSVMLLAASVRRISAVIASCGGIAAKASAWAELRAAGRGAARAGRCGRRRAAGLPRRASPPCTAESNGLMPASVAVHEPAVDVDARIARFFGSNDLQHRIQARAAGAAGQLLVSEGRHSREHRLAARRSPARSRGRPRLEAGQSARPASCQCLAQIPSVGRRPAGQLRHPLVERHRATARRTAPARRADLCRTSGRSRARPGSRPVTLPASSSEDLDLLRQSGVAAAPAAPSCRLRLESISAGCRIRNDVGQAEDPLAAAGAAASGGPCASGAVDGAAVGNQADRARPPPAPSRRRDARITSSTPGCATVTCVR